MGAFFVIAWGVDIAHFARSRFADGREYFERLLRLAAPAAIMEVPLHPVKMVHRDEFRS